MLCPHGGHYRDQCADPESNWHIVTGTCFAKAAEAEFRRNNTDLDESSLLGSYWLPPGEKPPESTYFDPAQAAEQYAAHERRMANLT